MSPTSKIRGRFKFSHGGIHDYAPEKPGVYAIWHKDLNRCLYVGRAENLQTRLLTHWQKKSRNKRLIELVNAYYNDLQFCYLSKPLEQTPQLELFFWHRFYPLANHVRPSIPTKEKKS